MPSNFFILLFASLLLNAALAFWTFALIPWRQEQYVARVLASTYDVRPTALLGDSILEAVGAVPDGFNLAVSGATVPFTRQEVLPVLQDLKPRRVLIGLGINDLRYGAEPLAVAADVQRLVDEVAQAEPAAEIIVLGLLPLSRATDLTGQTSNAEISVLNQALAEAASTGGHRFVNPFTLFSVAGALDDRLTHDGLHPNAAGQALLRRLLFTGLAQDAPG